MADDTLNSLVGISSHHLVLGIILGLFVLVLVGAGFALASGVRSKRHRNKQEELSKLVRDLQKEAEKLARRLGRGCLGYRSMSTCLAGIEVVGGAYFAITGSSLSNATAAQNGGGQVTVATLVGFAIIVTSAIQNRVHPYAKAVELRFRRWNLDFIIDCSELAIKKDIPTSRIAEVLIKAIRDSTRPFSDRPDPRAPEAQNPFDTQLPRVHPTALQANTQVAGDQEVNEHSINSGDVSKLQGNTLIGLEVDKR